MKHILIIIVVGMLALISVSARAQNAQARSATPVITAQPVATAQTVTPKPTAETLQLQAPQRTARAPQPDILARPAVSSACTSNAHVTVAPHAEPQPDLLPHAALGMTEPSHPEHVQAVPVPAKSE